MTVPWVSSGTGGDPARDPSAALLDAQDCKCAQCHAEIGAAEGQGGHSRHPEADTREAAEAAFDLFIETREDKYPKAAHCLDAAAANS